MRILLATDGSDFSRAAAEEIVHRPWPEGTEVRVISVAHPIIAAVADPTMTGMAMHEQSLIGAREHARAALEETLQVLRDKRPDLKLSHVMPEGSIKGEILDEAERWNADLLIVGSQGHNLVTRFLLGSVSHAMALHAPCSVEIVRPPKRSSAED